MKCKKYDEFTKNVEKSKFGQEILLTWKNEQFEKKKIMLIKISMKWEKNDKLSKI